MKPEEKARKVIDKLFAASTTPPTSSQPLTVIVFENCRLLRLQTLFTIYPQKPPIP